MSLEMFLGLLLFISTVTGLVVQALKPRLDGAGIKYSTNLVVLITSAVVSVVACISFYICADLVWTVKSVFMIFAEIVCSWGVAMFGYDKVVQLINQFIAIGALKRR